MKTFALINIFAMVMVATPISQTYSKSQSFGSSYVDDGTGKPQGKAWGNSYGSSSVTDPDGYTYKNEDGNNYFTPLNRAQLNQLFQADSDNVANFRAAFQRYGPVFNYQPPQPAPGY
ncbi:hypothetical protein CONCODRAFT_7410 [Conidiobolus coronatus NRRL 28638]|uniref:Secreted protein n=1 Tax=Conidiobolus coronatus (strain ATCC 28846 / CBS 209.66 / NRRL 28638) TaxID=796925 RepID=A0A137P4Z2_CONC2|nr:hypothetical protein CONCODRAFT_7410 [Conidiobolus coronatus NRRL 28638]|eukprot:KXN70075.1 hypothetical protein CONCODRAFT_7410 [Conidiobolus coronatus NRRL 28638]